MRLKNLFEPSEDFSNIGWKKVPKKTKKSKYKHSINYCTENGGNHEITLSEQEYNLLLHSKHGLQCYVLRDLGVYIISISKTYNETKKH